MIGLFCHIRAAKKQILPFFGLRHFVVSPVGGNLKSWTRVNHYKPSPNQQYQNRFCSLLQRLHGKIVCANSDVAKSDRQKIKSWLTPTDRATRCVTLSRYRTVHKAGCWVWSTGDGRRSTVDNAWQRSTCRREIILSSEVGEMLQWELRLFLEIFEFCICSINILQLQEALSRDQKLWIQWRHDSGPYAMAWNLAYAMTV